MNIEHFDGVYKWSEYAKLPHMLQAVIDSSGTEEKNSRLDEMHKKILLERLRLKGDERILDFGCGVGRISEFLAPYVKEIRAIDTCPEMIERAKKHQKAENITYVKQRLDEVDGNFDIVLDLAVSGYFPKEMQEETRRLQFKLAKRVMYVPTFANEEFNLRDLWEPKVSIIIPTYNHGNYIANAINSLLLQTYGNVEIIVIDDGSKDLTSGIVKRFADDRLHYVKTEHKGLVSAQNLGMGLATGEICSVHGADDMSFPDRIEKIIDYFPDSDVVYHGIYNNMWSKNECVARVYKPAERFDKDRLLKEQYLPGVPLFKKEVWEKKPFREETKFCYDWMFYLDWTFSGFKFKNVDIGLYDYIRTVDSASTRFALSGERDTSIEKIKEIMRNEYAQN